MERKTKSTGEFEEAIKNFSKISLEVDKLIVAGNADAHRLMNKSIEDRNEAIATEATKRLESFEIERKKAKSHEMVGSRDTMEKTLMEEVKMEFDKGVDEQMMRLRGNSAIDVSKGVENKKSENAEDSSDEESEDGSDEDSGDTETTEKDSSEEDDDDDDEDSSEGENSDDNESTKADEADSNKK